MKKILSLLLALSMMLAVLAACNTSSVEPNSGNDPAIEGSETEVIGDITVDDSKLNLVVDGASDYVIVRGENAYISELTASTELQSYIKKITGVEIPIVTDATAPVEKEIVVGKTNREEDGEFDREELGEDGLVIKTNGKKLFLVGGEQRGTLYSVYEFLEEYLGCRFYTNTFEIVPTMETLSLDKIEEDKQIPVFTTRATDWKQLREISSKRKLSGTPYNGEITEAFGGSEVWTGYGLSHTITMMASGEVEGDNPCLTSEDVFQKVLASTRAFLEQDPDADYISISQPDNTDSCSCDNCKALLAEVGEPSGLYILFVNRIAEEIKDEYPNVIIHTFAYRHTCNAPKNVMVSDNVMVQLCTWKLCSNHVYGDSECDLNSDFVKHLADWNAIAKNVSIWDYTANYSHYNSTYPNLQALRLDMKVYADNGLTYIFEQGNYQTTDGSFGDLRSYLITELLWNPYMSEEEYNGLIVQFLKDYYGAGWEYILEYINISQTEDCLDLYGDPLDIFSEELKNVHDAITWPEFINEEVIRNWENYDWSECIGYYKDITRPEIIDIGYDLFAKAEAAAETEEQKYNIRKSALQVEYLDLHYEGTRINNYTGVAKALTNYFSQGPGREYFTSEEIQDIRREYPKMINAAILTDYAARNRAFAEKLLYYGITHVREGDDGKITNFDVMDFTQYPHNWQS